MAGGSIDDPDMTLSALFKQWPVTMEVFMRHGMLCAGCYITPFHTVIDACEEYQLNEDAFRAELRAAVASKGPDWKMN